MYDEIKDLLPDDWDEQDFDDAVNTGDFRKVLEELK